MNPPPNSERKGRNRFNFRRDQHKALLDCNLVVGEDRISELPDEILVSIVSRLTVREAAATRFVSTRWRHLWRHITRLNFDAKRALKRLFDFSINELPKNERLMYAKWVNQVLEFCKCTILEEFRICFPLDHKFKCDIEKWLTFAFSRNVQSLQMDLLLGGVRYFGLKYYTLTSKFFSHGEGTSLCTPIGFKSLKALSLGSVNLGEDVVDFFLDNCPILERLCIRSSCFSKPVSLKVAGPSLLLKHLEILECPDIRSIEIRDANLASLKFRGRNMCLILVNVPLLVNMDVGAGMIGGVKPNKLFAQISCCLSQLVTLVLEFDSQVDFSEFPVFPRLTNLKELMVGVCPINGPILKITSLIEASTYLEKFVLKHDWVDVPQKFPCMKRKIRKCPLQHLKVVKFAGYFGHTCELELAMYFLQDPVALETFVVDPHYQSFFKTEGYRKLERSARTKAKKQLGGIAPEGVKLVIL